MSLPEEYRTARFESLPEGLKAKAEALIKKKFGLEDRTTSVSGIGIKTQDEKDKELLEAADALYAKDVAEKQANNDYPHATIETCVIDRSRRIIECWMRCSACMSLFFDESDPNVIHEYGPLRTECDSCYETLDVNRAMFTQATKHAYAIM